MVAIYIGIDGCLRTNQELLIDEHNKWLILSFFFLQRSFYFCVIIFSFFPFLLFLSIFSLEFLFPTIYHHPSFFQEYSTFYYYYYIIYCVCDNGVNVEPIYIYKTN